MRSRLSSGVLIVTAAAFAALVLTITRPSPEGILKIGVGDSEVRAAPGQRVTASTRHNLAALQVVNMTLIRVRDQYVDSSRIDPKQMLYSALDSVQFNIPEVLVEPFPDRNEVVVVVNDQKQKFDTAEVDSPWRLSAKLKKIFRFIEAHMNPGADLAAVEYAAVNGMLGTLDPHSVLLDPETAREMDVSTSGKFGGLGIVIRMINRKLTVVKPIKGTPAFMAGVERGDHIMKINDELTENLTLQESVDRMRGDPKTRVTLWIERKGTPTLLRYDLVRDIIMVESVEYKLLAKKVGLIRVKQFSGSTAKETRAAMDELRAQGATSWVLDLRWNPGGLLEQAIQVSDLFVETGTIVTTVGGRERDPRRAKRGGTDAQSPLAVLVNGNSASASEIVAGALKNLDRAIIIGNRTFGKGSVQVLYDNDDGSKLKLTIAQYLTPGDRSIQSVGITPDIDLNRMWIPKQNKEAKDQVRLLPPSKTYGEKDLSAHLISTYARTPEKATYDLSYVFEAPTKEPLNGEDGAPEFSEEEEPLDDDIIEDFEMQFARDLVASIRANNREEMVKSARAFVAKKQIEEAAKLSTKMAALGVDWSAPPAGVTGTAALTGRVEFSQAQFQAGDTAELTATLSNGGTTAAYQVHVRVSADDPIFGDTELPIGKIEPGETKSYTTRLKIPKDALDRVDELSFTVGEARGAKVELAPVTPRLVSAKRPVFAYAHQLIDRGNGDGLVQTGEQHVLQVTIRNTGDGAAEEPTAILRNASGDGIVLSKARVELGEMKPGESKTVEFVFDVTTAFKGKELHVEMSTYDAVLHASVTEKLVYPIRPAAPAPTPATGFVEATSATTELREAASDDAQVIGRAAKGARFVVTGRSGSWVRVELDKGRPGFVLYKSVKKASKPTAKSGFQERWQVTPPQIGLSIPSYVTKSATYQLRGQVKDDTHVEDVYVFVSNPDANIDNRKVFYKSNRGGKSGTDMEFLADLPLWNGSNRITVIARETDEVRAAETFYVYRQSTQATAKAPEKALESTPTTR